MKKDTSYDIMMDSESPKGLFASKGLTTEQLLYPRYKVIADFWDNPFDVGDIIQFEDYRDYHNFLTGKVLGQDWSSGFIYLKKSTPSFSEGTGIVYNLRAFVKYPHLFRKLEWWEDRDEKDMPEYVKSLADDKGDIFKIEKWNMELLVGWINEAERSCCSLTIFKPEYGYVPATHEEYNEYQKTAQAKPSK